METRKKIQVRQELKDLLTPLSPGEFNLLCESCRVNGIRDPLSVWEREDSLVLLDGHNRLEIAHMLDLPYEIRTLNLGSDEAARNWVLLNQMSKRNLSDYQLSFYRGMHYVHEKKQGHRSDLDLSKQKGIHEGYGVSYKTIKRDANFAKGIIAISRSNPELKNSILTREIKLHKFLIEKVGTGEIKAEDLIAGNINRKTFTTRDIGWAAIEYVLKEKRDLREVLKDLNMNIDDKKFSPTKFFKKWMQ